MSKPVLPANRRRKGFESVQKGYRSADARPLFFEKELLYCKLTVASDIEKGLLLVSFGAVESLCFGVLKKAFLYRIALHELKKLFFSANQKFSIYRKLYALPSKAAFFTYKKLFIRTNLSLFPPKITLFCPQLPLPTPLNLLFAKNTAVLLMFA